MSRRIGRIIVVRGERWWSRMIESKCAVCGDPPQWDVHFFRPIGSPRSHYMIRYCDQHMPERAKEAYVIKLLAR